MTDTIENKTPYNQIDHRHCWEKKNPPCGQKIEHLKCCLCERLNPKAKQNTPVKGIDLTQYTPEEQSLIKDILKKKDTPESVEEVIREAKIAWGEMIGPDSKQHHQECALTHIIVGIFNKAQAEKERAVEEERERIKKFIHEKSHMGSVSETDEMTQLISSDELLQALSHPEGKDKQK